MKKVALVVGAHGVIGRGIAEELERQGGWEIICLSRRGRFAVDLLDAADAREKLSALKHVTHVFYAAYQDRPTWGELVAPNVMMLQNLLDGLEPVAKELRHVSLMQGFKVYGAHLGPFKTPAREDDPLHMPPEFNVDQQTLLASRARGWSWSAIRPSVVSGMALGNPMNLTMVIGVYASIAKALGVPLRFPGKPGAYDTLMEMTDGGLLARATIWAATTEKCANEAFNIVNGDLFRWSEMWPRLARYFDMPVAPPLPLSLETVMADKEPVWQRLSQTPYRDVSSWRFGDGVFSWNYDFFSDSSKARRYGFHEYVDTFAMFTRTFDELRAGRILP